MELIIQNTGKKYGKKWALKNFSLKIKEGILGLLGPNGAGKTTLLRIIATVMPPTEGNLFWNGTDVLKKPNLLRADLGYLPQSFGVYDNLNAKEFLYYLATAKGLYGKPVTKRIDDILDNVGLSGEKKTKLKNYSGGMKQRIGIAQALLNNPKLLILDEPTVGLDPEERIKLRNMLTELARDRIVIFSTHIVSDIEAVSGNVAIINNGILWEHINSKDLIKQVENKVWEMRIPKENLDHWKNDYLISNAIGDDDHIKIKIVSEEQPSETAVPAVPSMEDAYLYYLRIVPENKETA